ncbi:hypothetical protein L6R52_38420 [Myxococcota bacterium]|nr:hypothetical protein [Myxococcota bacterium]
MTIGFMDTTPQPTNERVRGLLRDAEAAPTYETALPFVTEALVTQLLDAMKASKMPKADQAIESLKRSGLDQLLVEAMLRGKLTLQAADRHLNRMRDGIKNRSIPVQDVKLGILAFDGAAQRLALVAGKGGAFQYPLLGNHPRDSLITFASSLHR